ncbi:MAG: V-type ATPase subunit [Nanoarchaeota archaeon]
MVNKITSDMVPYTYARVSAMKSKLIDRSDYHKLLKMDLTSITRFLQDAGYKEIIELSGKFSGIELVDQALKDNQVETFKKLRKISPQDMVDVINLYLCRWDYYNLKIVLRGLFSNTSKEETMDLVIDSGNYSREHFAKLFETNSIWEAIANSKFVSEKDMQEAYEAFKKTRKLIELENMLDKLSFRKSVSGAGICPKQGMIFKRFLLRDIDIINIKNILRFKKEGLDQSSIMEYMILSGLRLKKKDLEALAKKETIKDVLEALNKTYYSRFIDFVGFDDLYDIEVALQNVNLKSSNLKAHQNPLSIAAVLNYMITKIIEVRNLRSIVKSKHLGIDQDYVEKKLLVV